MGRSTGEDPTALTDIQRELLRTAVREGYFKVPRETTLVTLAEENDLSDVEASQELRRSLDSVLRTVVDEE